VEKKSKASEKLSATARNIHAAVIDDAALYQHAHLCLNSFSQYVESVGEKIPKLLQ
jgi:hypothetical protein